ncbi:glycoside hydrolase family 32 protein [Croceitalea sp. MTPC5]|uniref:glycoside hydrolase family 32 protein n=1 Tax=Croceitalea sp. MTPC5 TaxID=3056565 RepID=UPI002B3E5797|nr:glycoside hydrolase family 32 protein [Croceitalea sp. MTPC5]
MIQRIYTLFVAVVLLTACKEEVEKEKAVAVKTTKQYDEMYRPQYHFSPKSGWMNDPNGLVYHDGLYHLFYQYFPDATVWGPMHWGHAVSKDLMNWEHKPIALFPDEKGFIFSGSAVVDVNNTSGFGKDGKVPIVAVFTYFRLDIEKAGGINTQTQGIAYSLDNGDTWIKYEGNPVLDNTTMKDFRDPKVFWHEGTESWIMVLVAGDHAKLYRSKNLKDWNHISDFGKEQGAHGGVWECPDLFKLKVEGSDEEKWVLIISIGSGGPNGGSGTQYFIGDFDGDNFISDQKMHRWLDWGADNYAGVTYNNTPNGDRIFVGWMSNWQYALKTPTSTWRSTMTLPRKLSLKKRDGFYDLKNYPISSLDFSKGLSGQKKIIDSTQPFNLTENALGQAVISFKAPKKSFKLSVGNVLGEATTLLFDMNSNLLMLDRTKSGKTNFNYEFGNKLHYMPVKDLPEEFEVKLFLDRSSIEIFLNKGQYVMTDQIFPTAAYTNLTIENESMNSIELNDFKLQGISSIWEGDDQLK